MKKLALLLVPLALTACATNDVRSKKEYSIWVEHTYLPPIRDNRFKDAVRATASFGETEYFSNQPRILKEDLKFDMDTIVRCDNPVTICRHGVIKPEVHITMHTGDISEGKIWAEGLFVVGIAREQVSSSDTGYIKNRIADGFPILKEEVKEISFSGFIESGKPILVSGPYGSKYQIAVRDIKLLK